MAQAKTASGGRSRSQKKPSARSRGSSKSTKASTSKPKQAASKQAKAKGQNADKQAKAKGQNASKPSPVAAVENTAKEAGKTVGRAASKAKVPLLAGGAALAGAAGGIALGAHQARRHKGLSKVVNSDDLAKAAKRVGHFGVQMGHVASELQRAREDSSGNGHSRSPIEVVLEGLTTRRSND